MKQPRTRTVGALLASRAHTTPSRVFIRLPDQQVTFEELDTHANRLANSLRALGVQRGEVVASMQPTSLASLATWFGTAKTAIVQAPINLAYHGASLTRLIGTINAKVIIADHDYWPRIADIAPELPALRHLLVPDLDVEAARDALPRLTVTGLESATRAADDRPPSVDVAEDDPSSIIFTSGTTGPSKAILRSHSADLVYAESAYDAMQYTSDDVQYLAFPLFHGFARNNGVLPMAMAGGTIVLLPRFSLSGFWDTCRSQGVTTFNFLGSTIAMLMNQPASERDRDHQVVKGHGAPVPAALLPQFRDRFGVRLVETYGSSELGIITTNRDATPGSCGTAVDSYAVEIHDDSGRPVDAGIAGEIVVTPRGRSAMFTRYVGTQDAVADSVTDGWFHTGDIGRMDDERRVHFIDRKKDAIRRRGENVSSWEVELALMSHPAVLEAAAYGVPSALTEEDVAVSVVLSPGKTVTPAELIEYCVTHLPSFAVPRYVSLADELPKTPTGRVQKMQLREHGAVGAWDREAQSA